MTTPFSNTIDGMVHYTVLIKYINALRYSETTLAAMRNTDSARHYELELAMTLGVPVSSLYSGGLVHPLLAAELISRGIPKQRTRERLSACSLANQMMGTAPSGYLEAFQIVSDWSDGRWVALYYYKLSVASGLVPEAFAKLLIKIPCAELAELIN